MLNTYMRARAHHLAAALFTGAVLLGTGTWFAAVTPSAQAACGTGSSVVITDPGNTSTTQVLTGIHTLHAYSTPTTASGMSFILTGGPQQTPIGEAIQAGSDWRLDWDTRNVPNGTYQLIAIAHFGSATTLDCGSPSVGFAVQNTATQAPKLTASIAPNTWQGPVGSSQTFTVDAIYVDQYGRQSHVGPANPSSFVWHTSLGALSTASGPSTVLSAGSAAGSGAIGAEVSYSGLTAQATAAIKVTPPTSTTSSTTNTTSPSNVSPSPTPAPTTATGSDTTPISRSDAARLATMPTIFRPTQPTNSNPVVSIPTLSCLEKKVGATRFSEISTGKSEPTAAERKLSATCFTGPEPIPAVLAPVAPTHINELEQTHDLVSVASAKNTRVTNNEGKQITGVLVSGKGAPNTSIFIYIFSDPLVLRAQTDAKGAWSYVLETPLKPGNHEVYAVAEKDAGTFVRSSALPISIAAAAPGSQTGSLVIETKWSAAQVGFIALAILMVLASIIVVIVIGLRRRRPIGTPAGATAAPTTLTEAAPASASASTPAATTSVPVPGQTFHPTTTTTDTSTPPKIP
jgi:hypothetical protein